MHAPLQRWWYSFSYLSNIKIKNRFKLLLIFNDRPTVMVYGMMANTQPSVCSLVFRDDSNNFCQNVILLLNCRHFILWNMSIVCPFEWKILTLTLSNWLFISFRNEVIAQNYAMNYKAINKRRHHVLSDYFKQKKKKEKTIFSNFTHWNDCPF